MSTMANPSVPVLSAVCVVLAAVEHIAVGAAVDDTGRLHLWPTVRTLTTPEETSALRAFNALTDWPLCWHPEVHS